MLSAIFKIRYCIAENISNNTALSKPNGLFIALALFVFLLPLELNAQFAACENLNISNGLPSNHVYCHLVDRHGYLWMGTDKGVVRYNGYRTKIYNYSDGLSKDDIWKLYEDKKGRIWLLTISDKVGYIYNNEYKRIVNPSNKTLYPRHISEYDDAICFTSPYIDDRKLALCVLKNDTFYSRVLDIYNGSPILYAGNRMLYPVDDTMASVSFDLSDLNHITFKKEYAVAAQNISDSFAGGYGFILGSKNFNFFPNKDFLGIIDIKTALCSRLYMKALTGCEENIALGYVDRNSFVISGTKHVCIIDSDLHVVATFPLDSITDKGTTGYPPVTYCIIDALWGVCAATAQGGIFINHVTVTGKNNYIRSGADLRDFIKVGNIYDTVSYWWNNAKKILASVSQNGTVSEKYFNIKNLEHVVHYFGDSDILACNDEIFWLNTVTGKLTDFYPPQEHFGLTLPVIDHRNNIIVLSKVKGLMRFNLEKAHLSYSILDIERYNDLAYDSLRRLYWAYNNDKILLVDQSGKPFSITGNALTSLGINDIQQIVTDNSYGNIFLKEYDKLVSFNIATHRYIRLLSNYRLVDAKIVLKNNVLIVAGKFGTAFCKILGPSRYSIPVIYSNPKNSVYADISDLAFAGDKLLLNTDKGLYSVNIPTDSVLAHNRTLPEAPYRLTLTYGNVTVNVKENDTVRILQNDPKLQFDIINPLANGNVKYQCRIDGVDTRMRELRNNEYVVPRLPAENYYYLSLVAYDDVWRSRQIHLSLFVVPYWWQTYAWRTTFLIAGLAIALAILLLAIYITKRVVTANAVKRNKLLELELKSIYAQINPHFIFNTLNTLQSFIHKEKTDEAYTHVSKFSRLLRSYLDSSRSKFIAIEDEVQNLKNFIELQQVRFKNKFDYEISVDETIAFDTTRIPAMLIQPIVENAINHGLFHKESEGFLKIKFQAGPMESQLICVIEDNGVGRKKAKMIKESSAIRHKSHGDELVKELIYVLNKYEKMDIEMTYKDAEEPLTGTTVEIKINNTPYEN